MAAALTAPSLAAQATMATDRPDFTESATTVGTGMVQVETGYSVEPASDFDATHLELLARGGLSRTVEVRAARLGARRSYLGTKVGLIDAPDGALAVIVGATFPYDARTSDQRFTPSLHLAGGRTVGRLSYGAMSGIAIPTEYGGVRFTQTFVLGTPLLGSLSGFAEYRAEVGGDDPAVHMGHAGLTLGLTGSLQLDAHAAIPLGDAGSGFIGGGVAFRFRLF